MPTDNKVLEKVRKLVLLANDGGEDSEESRTAAVQVTKLMKEHELVLIPKAEIDRVQKLIGDAQALARTQKADATQKMLIGGIAGLLLSKQLKF